MDAIYEAHELMARSGAAPADPNRPPVYKVIGICLAIASGVFIGISFVLKKVGLLKANEKYNEVAGEGYGYLKNWYWWAGMTLMIVGEICNFVAYAFVDAILVTPLGALSVVITTVLSAIFLKERLSFVGKVGCFNCIIGSVVIVLNAPAQSAVADIQQMQHYVIAPGFLTYAGVIIVGCAFIALWAGPRYGKKSMLVYLSICSLIGGLSVVATQGLGSAVVAQAGGKPQFNQWFLYVLLVFVVATLLTEIIYLNKALNIFNAALVTPTYYVFFTSATILTSAILFRGFRGTAIQIVTVVMGFFQICAGVILLQLSKSAKDVPDAAVLNGDLDQIRQVGEQEQPETEPKADAIRGAAALVRRFSSARQKMEQKEFERLHQEKMQDHLEPVGENEIVQWDGLRRRKTVIGDNPTSPLVRRKTLHPPLGMAYFPDEDDEAHQNHQGSDHPDGVLSSMRSRASTMFSFQRQQSPRPESTIRPVPMTEIVVGPSKGGTEVPLEEPAPEHTLGLPPALRKSNRKPLWSPRSKPLPPHPEPSPHQSLISPPNSARRQWSFTNFMGRNRSPTYVDGTDDGPPGSRGDLASRGSAFSREKQSIKHTTEEERLGLVKGDSVPTFLTAPTTSTSSLPSSPVEPPPVYPSLAHAQVPILLSTSFAGGDDDDDDDDDDNTGRGRFRTPHHTRAHSTIPEESNISDALQMTNRADSDPLDPRTVMAIATAAERARSSMRNIVNPPPVAVISSSSGERGIRSRQRPSPPPTYRQAQQAQTQHQSNRSPPPPMTATSSRPSASSREVGRTPAPAPPQAPEVTSQAQRGRVLARGLAQIVPVSDRSRSSSTSQNRMKTRGERINRSAVIPIEQSEGTTVSLPRPRRVSPEQVDVPIASADGTTQERRVPMYEGEGYDSPLLGELSPAVLPRHASPELVDENATETKDRFEARSRRERDKRRMRMSLGTSTTDVGGMI